MKRKWKKGNGKSEKKPRGFFGLEVCVEIVENGKETDVGMYVRKIFFPGVRNLLLLDDDDSSPVFFVFCTFVRGKYILY